MNDRTRIIKPVIIIGAPRAGTTILQRALSLHNELWHLPKESHFVLEGRFQPFANGFSSNRVTAEAVADEVVGELRKAFYNKAINLNRVLWNPSPILSARGLLARMVAKSFLLALGTLSKLMKPAKIRFLEKTPRNSLRVPMLDRIFPDAFYVWIKRSAPANIDSIIAGWYAKDKMGPFKRERYASKGYWVPGRIRIKGYDGKRWKFALVPGWEELDGKSIGEVASLQYFQCNWYAKQDLKRIPSERVFEIKYEDFVGDAKHNVRKIFEWAGLPPSSVAESFASKLPRINTTFVRGTWKQNRLRFPTEVEKGMGSLAEIVNLEKSLGY